MAGGLFASFRRSNRKAPAGSFPSLKEGTGATASSGVDHDGKPRGAFSFRRRSSTSKKELKLNEGELTKFKNPEEWHPPKAEWLEETETETEAVNVDEQVATNLMKNSSSTPPSTPSPTVPSSTWSHDENEKVPEVGTKEKESVISPPKVQRKSPPISSRGADTNAKRQFWENVFKHPHAKESKDAVDDVDCSSSDDSEDLVKHDVLEKKKWLQQAFTPTGGGNMLHEEEDTEEPTVTETESAPDDTEDVQNFQLKSPPKPKKEAIPGQTYSYSLPVSPTAAARHTPLDRRDEYQDAYRLWHSRGLLSWCPSPQEDPVNKSIKFAASIATAPVAATMQNQRNDHVGETRTSSGQWVLLETITDSFDSIVDATEYEGTTSFAPVAAVADDSHIKTMKVARQASINKSHGVPLVTLFGGSLSPREVASQRVDAYHDYVKAYTAYIRDRKSPEKAQCQQEARHLLEVAKAI